MNSLYHIPAADYVRLLPEILLTCFGVLIMIAEAFHKPTQSRKLLGALAYFGVTAATLASLIPLRNSGYFGSAFFGLVQIDRFSIFFHFIICFMGMVAIMAAIDWLEMQQERAGEFYGVMLLGMVGMLLMSSATELVLIFVALEISSIASYILAGYKRRSAGSAEAALKYFLLGSFATAFFLYGVAIVFGLTNSTRIERIAYVLQASSGHQMPSLLFVAIALMLVGIGFKIGAAPFHVWTPDVYEGAPSPVVALMSTAPKAAAFAVLLRILFGSALASSPVSAFGSTFPGWTMMLWLMAALSMTLGNIGALAQSNVKRMLAYSSIAHAGYMLVAFVGASGLRSLTGITAVIFYTASYAAMNMGAFIVVTHIGGADDRWVSVQDYAGLGKRSPLLAATLTIFMLSLIGIPLTGGFFAKFYVFSAALGNGAVWLTIIGLINSAIAAYYYLRLIVVMYMCEPQSGADAVMPEVPGALRLALAACVFATLLMGIYPSGLIKLVAGAAQDLIH